MLPAVFFGLTCPSPAYASSGDDMKRLLPIGAILCFSALLLLRPQAVSAAAQEGLLLCYRTVIPSLFPFFVAVSLLVQLGFSSWLQHLAAPFMGPLFRLRGVCAMPLLAGLLGGYPTGARTAADLYSRGLATRQEAEVLLGFCNNCGPAFLLSFVGVGMLGSVRAGAWLLLVHIAAALLTGMLLCRLARSRGPSLPPARPDREEAVPLPRALTCSVGGALTSTLGICAYVVLFRVVTALLPGALPPWAMGFLEMVSAVAAVDPDPGGFVAAAGIVAWGGLSVHCQTMSVAGDLSLKWHWIGKALQAAISVALAALVGQYALLP